mgnify:CR=1 FL=1
MHEYEVQVSHKPDNTNDHSTRSYQTTAYSKSYVKSEASSQYPGWIIDWVKERVNHGLRLLSFQPF